MNIAKLFESYFDELWPINRSLSGDGNRKTLNILGKIADIEIFEVPSGTPCFDWIIPPEWNVKKAWLKYKDGEKILDFQDNNLHLLGYSIPFKGEVNYEELKDHLFTLPDFPDWIPYVTSYYSERWGFCMSHNKYKKLKRDQIFEVMIDSRLNYSGSMTFGEAFLEGETNKEILLSTYICHPSMANNELCGPILTAFLHQYLKNQTKRKYSYRFLFVPETIGPIYYLSKFGDQLKRNVVAGFVINTIGTSAPFVYKKSRRLDSITDRATSLVLKNSNYSYSLEEFSPIGSDERQYCSPGFNLPIGSLMRSKYSTYPEYHTSADNKDIVSFEAMRETLEVFLSIFNVIENNQILINRFPNCEPNLGKRNLYPTISQKKDKLLEAILWLLNYSDGSHDIIQIGILSGLDFKVLLEARDLLVKNLLLIDKNNDD